MKEIFLMRSVQVGTLLFMVSMVALLYITTELFTSSDSFAAQPRREWKVRDGWQVPACTQISGVRMLAFVQTDGEKILFADRDKNRPPVNSKVYSDRPTERFEPEQLDSITPLRDPNTLLANYNGNLVMSVDSGCTWNKLNNVKAGKLIAAPDSGAYIINDGVGDRLKKNPPSLIFFNKNKTKKLTPPLIETKILVVEPDNPRHLRAAGKGPLDSNGNIIKYPPPNPHSANLSNSENYAFQRVIVDSDDGGNSWKIFAPYPPASDPGEEMAINPADPDQIIIQNSVSFDGGKTWLTTNVQVNRISFSPTDGNIVWALGSEFAEEEMDDNSNFNQMDRPLNGNSSYANSSASNVGEWDIGNRFGIFYSKDGGRSFTLEVRPTEENYLNVEKFYPHPADPEIVYYIDGISLNKYDRRKKLTETKLIRYPIYDGFTGEKGAWIEDLVFSPANSSLMYLGFRKNMPIN